ncbi:hypothetical protein QZH41_009440 [Actinostola sp. cb2023]|nr:hypothetical protein QZH41_009440 [Actinostola sp. cb2023]
MENAEKLLIVMMDENEQLFHIPSNIKSEVKRHLLCLQSGYDEPILSVSGCQRVGIAEYEQLKDCTTRQSLLDLMNSIIDDLSLSIKMKEQRLKEFQRHHLDVFSLQFPNGKF